MTFKWNNNNKYGYEQQQTQIQLTNHQLKLAINTLHNNLEALEEYIDKIEKLGNYPRSRKQLFSKSINSPNRTADDLASDFLAQLYCLKAIVNKKPKDFREKVKEEYCRWVDAIQMNTDECPDERLKHFLNEINEILEGRGEKFAEQTEKWLDEGRSSDPRDVLKVFSAFQVPVERNREQEGLLSNRRNWNEVENESRFKNSDNKKGEQILGQVSSSLSSHDEFHFYSQKGQNPTNSEIIQDVVRDKSQVWSIDDVIIYQDGIRYLIKALIKKSVRLEYDETGYPLFNSENMYQESRFNEEEKAEINQALNISQSSSSSVQHYQKNKSFSSKIGNPTTPNSNNSSLGTVALITGILALTSLGIYRVVSVVKKSKKIKK